MRGNPLDTTDPEVANPTVHLVHALGLDPSADELAELADRYLRARARADRLYDARTDRYEEPAPIVRLSAEAHR